MISSKTVLGLIPARGGSKRIPGKNLRLFRGKPLVTWAIEQAKASRYIDTVMVSSDYQEILNLCPEEMRLKRPAELATDTASSEDAIRHALSLQPHDLFVLLQPTSPLRTSEDIDACIELSMSHKCVISTCDGVRNGAIYAAFSGHFLQTLSFQDPHPYEMPVSRSLDIDTEDQLMSQEVTRL